jgi:hypothetical protein
MTAYVLTPYQPFGGDVEALIAGADATLFAAQSATQYMGHSYDPVTRRLYFSANVLVDSVSSGAGLTKTNDTGHTLYDVLDDVTIAPGDSYNGDYIKNFQLCYLSVDTGEVTMVDVFDPTVTIPSGVHGSDGSWRMVALSTISNTSIPGNTPDPPEFKLVDPRTADCWVHMTLPDCSIYVFRDSEGYKQKLLPLGLNGHMEMIGITDNWLLVMGSNNPNGTLRKSGTMYTVPRLTTADETANAQLLAYFSVDQPSWMDTAYWRSLMVPAGACYIFGSSWFGDTRDYRLFRYDPPASIGSWTGSTQPGGSFTELTPWSAASGPNSNCAAWNNTDTLAGNPNQVQHWGTNSVYSLPATNQMALISILQPQNYNPPTPEHDPAHFRMDCTYYDIAGNTFDYHEGFVIGYMKADWTKASGASDAAFAVQCIREIDNYREMQAWNYGDDYTERWIEFVVQPVVGGVFTWDSTGASNSAVLAKYKLTYGSAPALLEVRFDASWLASYGAYATAIGNDNVVEQSVKMTGELEYDGSTSTSEVYLMDTGFHDAQTNSLWFGGFNHQSIKIDPSLPTYRGYWSGSPLAQAIVRLSWFDYANSIVRSFVHNPQL